MISTQLLQPKTVTTFTMLIVETDRSSNPPFRLITALGFTEHFKMKQTALPFSIVEMVWPIGTTVPLVWPSILLTGKTTAYYTYRVSHMFLLFIFLFHLSSVLSDWWTFLGPYFCPKKPKNQADETELQVKRPKETWFHTGFLEHWNSQKSLAKIRQHFSWLLEGIEKICKIFFS